MQFIDVEYIYGFVWWGVCKQSRWRHSVTEPSEDGGYVLLWQSYDNNKMVAMRFYGNVMITTRWWLCVTMFYIFNSTVIDWTCYIFLMAFYHVLTAHLFLYKISTPQVLLVPWRPNPTDSTFGKWRRPIRRNLASRPAWAMILCGLCVDDTDGGGTVRRNAVPTCQTLLRHTLL